MAKQLWPEYLMVTGEDGSALTNTTTPTSLLPVSRRFTTSSNFFGAVADALGFVASGRISTVVTTPGTLTLDLRMGATVVWTSGAMALNVVAKSNVSWKLCLDLALRSFSSTTAAFMGMGYWMSEAVIGSPLPSAGGSGVLLLPANTPAAGNTFDPSAALVLDMYGTWSVANASNSIQCHMAELVSKN